MPAETQYLVISLDAGLEGAHPDRESAEGYAQELREIGVTCTVSPFATGAGGELSAHVGNVRAALKRKAGQACRVSGE